MEVAAQEKIPCWHEGGLTEVYVGGVNFYQNAATYENGTLGQVVLFHFRALYMHVHVNCTIHPSAKKCVNQV